MALLKSSDRSIPQEAVARPRLLRAVKSTGSIRAMVEINVQSDRRSINQEIMSHGDYFSRFYSFY